MNYICERCDHEEVCQHKAGAKVLGETIFSAVKEVGDPLSVGMDCRYLKLKPKFRIGSDLDPCATPHDFKDKVYEEIDRMLQEGKLSLNDVRRIYGFSPIEKHDLHLQECCCEIKPKHDEKLILDICGTSRDFMKLLREGDLL